MEKRKFSRRDFLRLSAAATTGAIVAACAPVTPVVIEKEVVKEVPVEKVVTATPMPPKEPVKVSFSYWGNPAMKANTDAIIKAFEDQHPEIKLELIHVPTGYSAKLATMIAGGDMPDVVWLFGGQVGQLGSKGVLLDLKPLADLDGLDLSDFPAAAIKGMTHGDKLFALPYAVYVVLLWYNKDLFDQAGVDYPNRDWDWDILLDRAIKLTKGEAGEKIYGFLIRTVRIFDQETSFVWRSGGEFFNEDFTQCLLGEEKAVRGLQYCYDFKNKWKTSPAMAEVEALPLLSGGDRAIGTKRVAMAYDTNITPVMNREVKGLRYDCEVFPSPKDGKPGGSLFSDNIGMRADGKNIEAAWDWVQFQVSETAQLMKTASGMNTPSRLSLADNPLMTGAFGMNWQAMFDEFKVARSSLDYWIHFAEFEQIAKPELEAAWLGQKTITETVDTIVAKTDELLKTL